MATTEDNGNMDASEGKNEQMDVTETDQTEKDDSETNQTENKDEQMEVTEKKDEKPPTIGGTGPIVIPIEVQKTIFGVDKLRPDRSMYELLRDSDPEPELTEEEKEEIKRKEALKAERRIHEKELLHKMGEKLSRIEVSDIKIHFKIEIFDWKKAMTGPELMEYFDTLSQREPKPNKYNPGKFDHPPKFDAKVIGGYLKRLGKWELSNEARWIEVITSMQEPDEELTVEHFFRNMVATLRMPDNDHLFNELKQKTITKPKYIGQLLEDLGGESFFKRDLIEYCATLDVRRLFHYRKLLQDNYLMGFHTRYTEEGFQTYFLRMARDLAQSEPPREKPKSN